MNICNVTECNVKTVAKGLCDKHYRRLKKYGTYKLPEKVILICKVSECNMVSKSRGFCVKHYTRLLKHGDVNKVYRHVSKGKRYRGIPEYNVWSNMKARCYDANHPSYSNYGGRGISICNEWINNFPKFFEDMGERPSPKHKIDRINNDGNYEPSNCRWVTNKINCNNKRTNKYITFNGEKLTYAQWSERLGGDTHLVSDRIRVLGWSDEKAVSTPPRSIRKHL